MERSRWIVAIVAGLAAASALATPFTAIEPQAPAAGRPFVVRMIPQWGSSSQVTPRLYVLPLDRPAEGVRVVDATPSPALLSAWTRFQLMLPAGAYELRYYEAHEPDLAQPPDLVYTVVVTGTGPVAAVEYYSPSLDHYLVTADPVEMSDLDNGTRPGWLRTGSRFFVIDGRASLGVLPVCRLYGLPSAGLDTHFLSDDPRECASVLERWPDKWIKETDAAFALPVDYGPGCDTIEYSILFRLYNNRPDANHRYTTSLAVARQMIAAGWIAEGRHAWAGMEVPYWSCASSGWVPEAPGRNVEEAP